MMRQCVSVFAGLFLGCWMLSALTQAGDDKKEGRKPLSDEEFVKHASITDLAEIHLGKIAVQNAARPEVKVFGRRMVKDHTKSLMELQAVAEKKGLRVARNMDEKHQALAEKLGELKGAEFDREYAATMVKGHKKALEMYEHQARHGEDQALKAFATKSLPTLKKHYQMAQELAGENRTGSEGQGKDSPRKKGSNDRNQELAPVYPAANPGPSREVPGFFASLLAARASTG